MNGAVADSSITTQDVRIACADGVKIAATLHASAAPKAAIIISSGTGFRRSYYHPLAQFFAARGAAVLTYDYRGIGGSATSDLLQSADLPDWGRLDFAATIDWLASKYADLPISHLGHSAGGHIVGFAENAPKVRRHAFVAVGSGTWWRHWISRWPLALFFWWGLGPLSLMRAGHIRPGFGWTGEALPGPAFRTWRRWSNQSGYYRREAEKLTTFAALKAPIRSWVLTDDGIATQDASQDILDCFPNAPSKIVVRSPGDINVRHIGHEGAFKERCAPLWEDWRVWLMD